MVKNIPIPTAGVTLGAVALGNLLAPYSLLLKYTCGFVAAVLFAVLLAKIVMYPKMIKNDLVGNSIFASVSATIWMTVMQFCTYTAPFAPLISKGIWFFAIFAHFALMAWFTYYYIYKFEMRDVFPTYFIVYVGIIVASVTAPTFHEQFLGTVIFWFGFIAYLMTFSLVTARYLSEHNIHEAAKPLFCIYTAPMSLSLAGYLACVPDKSWTMILIMEIIAQGLLFIVLSQMPRLLRLPFYPSYAAFTFPFVITAFTLRETLNYCTAQGIVLPPYFHWLLNGETVIATLIVSYVTYNYCCYFYRLISAEFTAMRTEQED